MNRGLGGKESGTRGEVGWVVEQEGKGKGEEVNQN